MNGTAQAEILSPGAYASLQDAGRRGWRHIGVPWAGALDARLMRIANVLVGNAENTPVIECFDGGLHLAACDGPLHVAVAGHAALEVDRGAERRAAAPWRSLTLAPGDSLRIRRMEAGRIAVVAIAGLTVPRMLGSAATYTRAQLGGMDGRALAAGTRLQAAAAPGHAERVLPAAPAPETGPCTLRAVPGPQDDHFTPEALHTFFSAEYRVSPQADRMGVRLDGPALAHRGAPEIVSDATVPGSVQVPGNGLPIVLLADAQTAGGYPKIATVIGADLPRLAQCRPGDGLRFTAVSAETGEAAARERETETRRLLAAIRRLAGGLDEAALYDANLAGNAVDALNPEHTP
ncbi:5-oxoprolinase subunit C family protein [Pseudothauera rhizosphaerae]|uniref:Biotin-dependent carboxyltransferase family protein n=1 Tax=Pseudothauera rhizosphaerae TaxID=2565932 RepID=A0A4V3WBI2_9RHOO|nr:biotin-dependent carboxyltransferase family protein [Pseudothauera rhizosphaerae]THF63293.1 biotin-dependent carboxyltransferase family protein [Pseudothauera rhizosphaerae]